MFEDIFIEDKLRKEGGHIGVLLIKLQITLALKKLRWEQNSVVISIYKNLPEKMPLNLRLLFHHS